MVLLLAVPCCAFDSCPDEGVQKELSSNGGKDGDCGTCSPFFQCESCAIVSIPAEPILIGQPFILARVALGGFITASITEPHYDYWRPPQLG